MYNSSVAQLLRSDIGKRIQANSFFVGTLVTVNPATRFASVYVSNEDDLLQNVVVLDDVNIANLNNGDIVLVLQLVGGLNVILGSLSTNTGRQVELDNFSGGLKVGTVNGFLPDAIEYITSYITGTSVIEEPIFDAYNEICGYNYSYSYEYELAAVTLGKDVYAGEIRRFSNDLYAWSSSYESAYSYYDNSYDLGAEWVKWDDARYIQGIPVVDKKPSDNDTLVFDNTIGMYRPGVVGMSSIIVTAYSQSSSSTSTSSTSYVDLMSVSVTLEDAAYVLVTFSADMISSYASEYALVRLLDNSGKAVNPGDVRFHTRDERGTHAFTWRITEASGGSKTYKIQWRAGYGGTRNVTAYGRTLVALAV